MDEKANAINKHTKFQERSFWVFLAIIVILFTVTAATISQNFFDFLFVSMQPVAPVTKYYAPSQAPSFLITVVSIGTFVGVFVAAYYYRAQAHAQAEQAEQQVIQNESFEYANSQNQFFEFFAMMKLDRKEEDWHMGLAFATNLAVNSFDQFALPIISGLARIGITFSGEDQTIKQSQFVFNILVAISKILENYDTKTVTFSTRDIHIKGFHIQKPHIDRDEFSTVLGGYFPFVFFDECDFEGVNFTYCNFYQSHFNEVTNVEIAWSVLSADEIDGGFNNFWDRSQFAHVIGQNIMWERDTGAIKKHWEIFDSNYVAVLTDEFDFPNWLSSSPNEKFIFIVKKIRKFTKN